MVIQTKSKMQVQTLTQHDAQRKLRPGPRILVAVGEGAASHAALLWTAEHIADAAARIDLVSIVGDDAPSATIDLVAQNLRDARDLMAPMVPATEITIEMRLGDRVRGLIDAADRFDATLLVTGTHASAADPQSALRSMPGRLAAAARCPTVVVPAQWMPVDGPVVVGCSADMASVAAVRFAAAEARAQSDELVLVHVWDLPSTGEIPSTPGGPESIPERQRSYLESIAATTRLANPGLTVHADVIQGHPVARLRLAAEHARLLAVGRRDRTALSRLLLGSVSRSVLTSPPCPVVVVPGGAS